MKKSIATIILSLFAFSIKAQIFNTGACVAATPFVPSNTVQPVNQSAFSGWLCYTANSTSQILSIKNIFNGINGGKITSVQVYKGICATLTLVGYFTVIDPLISF